MVTKNINVQLGDQSVSTNLNEYFSCIERYSFDKSIEDREFSETPSMCDQYSDYSSSVGQINSELGYYGTNAAQIPRGWASGSTGSVWYNISQGSTGAGATASVVMTVTEPIFLSPLYFGKGEHSGFIGIQSMIVQVQFDQLQRLWSHIDSANIISYPSGCTVAVNRLEVLVKQLTPDSLYKYPDIIPYPFNQITSFQNGTPITIASKASAQFSSGSITLNSIPTRLYAYTRVQNNDLTWSTPDTFGVLQSITVQLGTRVLLSTATQQDLYNISVRNGIDMSWGQWSQFTGGPLAIDLMKDIGMQPSESPGLLTRSSLQVTATFLNPSLISRNFVMYILVCEEGTVTINQGHMLKSIGVLTQADILSAETAPDIPYKQDRNIFGGAWYNDVWEGIKKVGRFVKDDILPVAKNVYDAYKAVKGNGKSGGEMDHEMMEAVATGGRKGRGLVGARMIKRDEL